MKEINTPMTKEEFEKYINSDKFKKFQEEIKRTLEEMEELERPIYAPWSPNNQRYL